MNVIVGLDPAINSPGLAILVDNRVVAATAIAGRRKALTVLPLGERINAVAALCSTWIDDSTIGLGSIDMLVYERPQIYGAASSRTDPDSLLTLAALAGAVAFYLRPTHILCPTPREWSAGTSKNKTGSCWDSTRGARLRGILSENELAIIPDSHDALDAVGLALHATSRALARPEKKIARKPASR